MVFNVMTRNCDDHTKNFSFLLRQGGAWELAPANDITFAYDLKSEWKHQHLMSVNGKFKDFKMQDMQKGADKFGVGEGPSIINKVREAIKLWPSFAKKAGVNKNEIERMGQLHLALK
jgi:serine/threonine-protein kinase HipA